MDGKLTASTLPGGAAAAATETPVDAIAAAAVDNSSNARKSGGCAVAHNSPTLYFLTPNHVVFTGV